MEEVEVVEIWEEAEEASDPSRDVGHDDVARIEDIDPLPGRTRSPDPPNLVEHVG